MVTGMTRASLYAGRIRLISGVISRKAHCTVWRRRNRCVRQRKITGTAGLRPAGQLKRPHVPGSRNQTGCVFDAESRRRGEKNAEEDGRESTRQNTETAEGRGLAPRAGASPASISWE